MSDDTKTPDVDIISEAEKIKRPKGRPKGSKNKNFQYKLDVKNRKQAIKTMWERGKLHWKLDSLQKQMHNAYYNRGESTTLVWLLSRQIGKTYTVCDIILEELMENPNWRIAFVAPQQNQARRVVKKTMQVLLQDCPEHLRPVFKTQEGLWRFPNGSELYVGGSDAGNIESFRGMTFERIFVDEFCFLDDFDYCMNSVLFPTMTTIVDPVMVMISSPPKTHDHQSNLWIDRAEEMGNLFTKTIYDCPRFSSDQIQRILDQQYHGDHHSVDFRREYMAERIPDVKSLVLPEASAQKIAELTKVHERPKFFTCTVSADWGVMDSNFVLFAYYDFSENKIVIEAELEIDGVNETTADIAQKIKMMEERLWREDRKRIRVCDNNLQLINDLTRTYDLGFRATPKDNLNAAVNEVRARISADEIVIHPDCKVLISQVKSAMWDKSRKKFKKAKDHHYDGVAALVYLVRNIDTRSNPYPPGWNFEKGAFISPKWYANNNQYKSEFHKSIADIFTVKKGKKRRK